VSGNALDEIVVTLPDAPVLVEHLDEDEVVVALLLDDILVEVIPVGVPGPPGVSGGYTHTQATPATTWTIAHNLGYRPAVQCSTTGGLELLGEVLHLSADVCQVSFSVARAGSARLA
jgi:hypothetical protein